MMVIYLPVKFKFDWTKHFRVRVRKTETENRASLQLVLLYEMLRTNVKR